MARIRTVKPEFWASEKIGGLTPLARLAFIGSWNHADDEGLLRWTPEYLSASVFMYDGLSAKRVQSIMDELVAADLVFPYVIGATRQKLAYVVNFREHQKINRPQPGKLSPPSIANEKVRLMYAVRDDWTCHLCLGPINQIRVFDIPTGGKNVPGHVELNLSMDHVIPQSTGGTDHPSNIRASHVSCNKARRDLALDQFRVPESVQDALHRSVNPHGTRNESSPPEGKGKGNREGEQGGEAEPPPSRCPEHIDNPTPGPCGQCADARRGREAWDSSAKDRATRQAEADRFAIRACQLCNSEGLRWHPESKGNGTIGRCDHQPLRQKELA